MKKHFLIAALPLLMTLAAPASAQKTLTLEDVYSNGLPQPKKPRWSWGEDGSTFTEGARKGKAPQELSADGSLELKVTGSKRVWRKETKHDYAVVNTATGEQTALGKGLPATELMFAKFSPAANRVAYVCEGNIYLEDPSTGEILPLTKDGGGSIVNGTSDWVYEEEFDLRDCFRWSPDGRYVAFWQFDTEGTGTFYMMDNVDSLYSIPVALPYPKVGTANSAVRVGVIDVATAGPDGADIRWFDLPGDPRQNYIPRMDFIPGANTVMIQQMDRRQQVNRVWYGECADMALSRMYEDRDEAFLNVCDNIEWLQEGKFFVWTSEKDGWRHLYKVARDGSSETLVTRGEFDVIGIARYDFKKGWVYFYATPEDDAVHTYLYRARLDGKKPAERITPSEFTGVNRYEFSADGRQAVHTFSTSNTPPRYTLVEMPSHKTVKVLEDNAKFAASFAEYGFPDREYVKVNIGEVILDAWIQKPKGFDPEKKYPVIFYVYGEPASSTVTDSWSRDRWSHLLCEQGWVVMSVDPRGTNNPRGRAWRKSVYRNVGILPLEDHAKAVLELEKTYSWMDRDRIGVWGWSGGGSSTANLMFKHPEIYKAGIAVAGVYNQLCYDTIYQERYMGLPEDNAAAYHDGSPLNWASGLQGKLMLIHGTGDDNVHYQCTEMLIDELVKFNKQFSLMVYPMRSHGINEREGTTLHLRSTMMRWWKENL